MRINNYIAKCGICSRRQADKLIDEKRVAINGILCEKGTKVEKDDIVSVDGIPIVYKKKNVLIVFNKPVGIECTTNTKVEGNIIDFINYPRRIFPIGRLDKDSEGLILLTNDGDIADKILKARNYHEKEYIVTVNKDISLDFLTGMSEGVNILGVKTRSCSVYPIDDKTFGIILTQGLNRQIRRMCRVFGYKVIKLKRIRIMNIRLGNLKLGHWRNVTKDEMNELTKLLM